EGRERSWWFMIQDGRGRIAVPGHAQSDVLREKAAAFAGAYGTDPGTAGSSQADGVNQSESSRATEYAAVQGPQRTRVPRQRWRAWPVSAPECNFLNRGTPHTSKRGTTYGQANARPAARRGAAAFPPLLRPPRLAPRPGCPLGRGGRRALAGPCPRPVQGGHQPTVRPPPDARGGGRPGPGPLSARVRVRTGRARRVRGGSERGLFAGGGVRPPAYGRGDGATALGQGGAVPGRQQFCRPYRM